MGYGSFPISSGQGVPAGGTANQVLSKVNSTDYNTQWVTPSSGGPTARANVNPVGIASGITYSQVGTTVTVTKAGHGLIAGSLVDMDITSGTAVDGCYTILTVPDANTFTYTAGSSVTDTGSAVILCYTRGVSGFSSIRKTSSVIIAFVLTTAQATAGYSVTTLASVNAVINVAFLDLNVPPTVNGFQIAITGTTGTPDTSCTYLMVTVAGA